MLKKGTCTEDADVRKQHSPYLLIPGHWLAMLISQAGLVFVDCNTRVGHAGKFPNTSQPTLVTRRRSRRVS